MRNPTSFALPILAALALAGCGGHHHHSGTASEGGGGSAGTQTGLVFSDASGTNANTVELTGTASGDANDTAYAYTVSTGGRTFYVVVPFTSAYGGTTLTVTSQDGSTVARYYEGSNPANAPFWSATSGTLSFGAASGGKATLTVKGLRLSPYGGEGTTTGTGTFQIDGQLVGVPVRG